MEQPAISPCARPVQVTDHHGEPPCLYPCQQLTTRGRGVPLIGLSAIMGFRTLPHAEARGSLPSGFVGGAQSAISERLFLQGHVTTGSSTDSHCSRPSNHNPNPHFSSACIFYVLARHQLVHDAYKRNAKKAYNPHVIKPSLACFIRLPPYPTDPFTLQLRKQNAIFCSTPLPP